MKILVTGGLGFIGSHTVVELINNGYEVVIADNLCNSKIEVLDKIEKITKIRPQFYKYNLTILEDVRKIFEENDFEIKSFKFERIPNNLKHLTDAEKEDVEKLLEKIEEDEDVTNVFHNME